MNEPLVWVPFEVPRDFDGKRVDHFLTYRLKGYSRTRVQAVLKTARVTRDGRVIRSNTRVHTSDKILIAYPRRPEKPVPDQISMPILFEDDHLVVIDKPANLLSHGTDKIINHTVISYIKQQRSDLSHVHLLHRLDRETSGVLALAKTKDAARRWTAQMEKRAIHKEYLALVRGTPRPKKGTIDFPIGREGKDIRVRQAICVKGAVDAVTRYETVKNFSDVSLVRAFPQTGRLHQIRVHLAAIGHPLLGDRLYTGKGELYMKLVSVASAPDEEKRKHLDEDLETLGFHRVALHAEVLRFNHPITGKPMKIQAPLPPDFEVYLKTAPR